MKKLITALLCLTMIFAATSCGKTLEKYYAEDEDFSSELSAIKEQDGVSLSIKDNTIIYIFDVYSIDGITEDIVTDDKTIEEIGEALEGDAEDFGKLCREVEKESGIKGVSIEVNYNYQTQTLVTKTFTSAD